MIDLEYVSGLAQRSRALEAEADAMVASILKNIPDGPVVEDVLADLRGVAQSASDAARRIENVVAIVTGRTK